MCKKVKVTEGRAGYNKSIQTNRCADTGGTEHEHEYMRRTLLLGRG